MLTKPQNSVVFYSIFWLYKIQIHFFYLHNQKTFRFTENGIISLETIFSLFLNKKKYSERNITTFSFKSIAIAIVVKAIFIGIYFYKSLFKFTQRLFSKIRSLHMSIFQHESIRTKWFW
jgi:hypothetical protein